MMYQTALSQGRPDGRATWSPVVFSGLLRGLVGAAVFCNLFLQMPMGIVPFIFALTSGILGNLIFLGVGGLIFSVTTGTGPRAFPLYARSFVVALPLYLLALPVVILLMPVLPADASFATAEGARQVITEMRSTLDMEIYRYTQFTIFSVQMVYLWLTFRQQVPVNKVWAAALLCMGLYALLFVTRVI